MDQSDVGDAFSTGDRGFMGHSVTGRKICVSLSFRFTGVPQAPTAL